MIRHKRWLLLILLIAFAVRAVAAITVQKRLESTQPPQQFLIAGDANGYWELAENLIAGKGFTVHEPPRLAMRMPGFPMFFSMLMLATGKSMLAIRIGLALVGTLVVVMVYMLGRRLFSESIGLTAAAICAVLPPMAGFSVLVLSETLFALGLVASLLALTHLGDLLHSDGSRRQVTLIGGLAGLLVSLACYVRPSWLLAAPCFVLLVYLFRRGSSSVHLAAIAVFAGLFLSLLPWAIRNQFAVGRPVWTTLWVGPSLYDGLNDSATGDSDMTFFERDNLMATLSEDEVDQHYRQKAWTFVRENPGRSVELAFAKVWRFWKPWPNASQFDAWWMKAAVTLTFLPVVVLAAIGIWNQRQNPWAVLIAVSPIIYFTAIHAVFVGSLRYRLPAEYPLCVLSSVGLHTVWRWCRGNA
ncbi:MAG: hypothetical protein CMJ78_26010 [Planctomycetaceae bacterium]|nr:hypothetical protein [Planctomycetaceae bacterium]